MRKYTQIMLEEREKLYLMNKDGKSLRDMAKELGRSHSSISRELRRNLTSKELGYLPDGADRLSAQRKARHGLKLKRNPHLLNQISCWMRQDRYSPEMAAAKLKQARAPVTISTEAIYQFIYSEEGKSHNLYRYLMRGRSKRNQHYGRKYRKDHGIQNRVSISQRPEINKEEFGHFEIDTTFFKGNQSINLLTMVDRKTGFLLAELNQSKKSDQITVKLLNNIIKFPKKSRRTITTDNGGEFALHEKVTQITGTPIFFCHKGSPWEKPYVEHTHAILHRFLPKNIDPKTLTNKDVQNAVNKMNHLPRKRFNFKSPAQMLEFEKFNTFGALHP